MLANKFLIHLLKLCVGWNLNNNARKLDRWWIKFRCDILIGRFSKINGIFLFLRFVVEKANFFRSDIVDVGYQVEFKFLESKLQKIGANISFPIGKSIGIMNWPQINDRKELKREMKLVVNSRFQSINIITKINFRHSATILISDFDCTMRCEFGESSLRYSCSLVPSRARETKGDEKSA